MWSALPEKAIHNAVKDYRRRLQAFVAANSGHWTYMYNVIIHITDNNRYI